jgi:hypothetical protein
MTANELMIDAFDRIRQSVHTTIQGLSEKDLTFRPGAGANSIAWLIWHLTRIQDDHIAGLAGTSQLWEQGWFEKFELPFAKSATGYGQTSKEVGAVKSSSKLLLDYYDAVHASTVTWLSKLKESDYAKVVDERWSPPVTLGVRLISILSDDLQHAGQAAYVHGLIK